jgi:hypothetical protein
MAWRRCALLQAIKSIFFVFPHINSDFGGIITINDLNHENPANPVVSLIFEIFPV